MAPNITVSCTPWARPFSAGPCCCTSSAVPPENSILFYSALRKARVPAELHIYDKGPHGVGLGNDKFPELKSWPERLSAWLGVRGLLKK